jgi:hypothetical protein
VTGKQRKYAARRSVDSWARARVSPPGPDGASFLFRLPFSASRRYLRRMYAHFYRRDKIWTLFRHTHSPCARLGICRAVWEILHLIRDSLPKRIKLLRPKINSASQSRSNKAEFVGFQFSSQTQLGERNLVLCHALEHPF